MSAITVISLELTRLAFQKKPAFSIAEQIFKSKVLGCLALSFCDAKDSARLTATCRTLKALTPHHLQCQLANKIKIDLKELLNLQRFFKIPLHEILDLAFHLECVDLSRAKRVQIIDIFQSRHCEQWKSFKLKYCQSLDGYLLGTLFSRCISLENLDCYSCTKMTDRALFSCAAYCPNLTSINLGECTSVSASGVAKVLADCPRLESLNIFHCPQINDEGLLQIGRVAKNLKRINLGLLEISPRSLIPFLKNNPLLEYLNLEYVLSEEFTTEPFERMGPYLKQLVNLHLSGIDEIIDDTVGVIARGCPALQGIDLSFTKIGNDSLVALARHSSKLTHVNISDCRNVDAKGILFLVRRAKVLKSLTLSATTLAKTQSSIMQLKPHLKVILR